MTFELAGNSLIVWPLYRYAVQMGIFLKPVRTSSLVSAMPVSPFIRTAWRTLTASNQPQRRDLPVVAPNSAPSLRSVSPSGPSSSVGNGPLPTLVVYAFEMPITCWICCGPTPEPEQAPPVIVLDDVT